MSEPVAHLSLRGVDKAFGDKAVLADLSLEVNRGETLTVLGASGSGKSVLLKLLIGLQRADRGEIVFDGTDVTRLDEEALLPIRRRVSMLFQGGALFDSLTVGENIAYPLVRQGRHDEAEIAKRIADRLAMVGLAGIEDLHPAELSGGMKKRVALARAIAGDPEVLLYDEPTTGLDPISTRRIDELIRSIQASLHVTSIVVTHDLQSAFWVSDRLAMLHEHKILAVLSPEEFRRSELAPIRDFVGAMPVDEAVRP